MIVLNRFIPFGSFTAMNLFGIIFARRGRTFTPADLRHEQIHTRQMREMLFLPFYVCYLAEWILRLLQCGNALRAYAAISFEREAYAHQADEQYLTHRPPFAWIHYLVTKKSNK